MTKSKRLSKLDKIPKNGIGIFECVTFVLIAIVSYVFFCHQDILVTAGHSIEYLNGHITDFYSACKKTDGTYGANYLPTTFILFAIWNIPMKLLKMTPTYIGDWSVPFIMWNKLLPTIAFFLSGVLMYKLATKRLGFDKRKAMLTVFLFFTTPMAFFSQFFFCQYDIFTVLFMLAGMYIFFKKELRYRDYFAFSLLFGIASTFKYFALVILVICILLRQKNVWKIMIAAVPAIVPIFAEVLFYGIFDRRAFIKSVFGFSALDAAGGFSINIGGVEINLLYIVLLVIIACAYFTKPTDFDNLFEYAMFYSCGVCFAFFGMMIWYPQWLLFMAPFWVLSTIVNKKFEIFFWIDTLLGVVLDVYIVNKFYNAVDQALLNFGILRPKLVYNLFSPTKMGNIFVYQDKNTLFTIISAIFLIGFIFKHPKFNYKKLNTPLESGRFIINVRFLAFTMAFIVAAFACLPGYMAREDMVYDRFGGSNLKIETINNKNFAEQYTYLTAKSISTVYIVTDQVKKEGKGAIINVDIYEVDTGKKVAHGQGREKDIPDGSHEYKRIKLQQKFYPKKDTLYKIRFSTNSSKKVAIYFEKNPKETASYYNTYQRDYTGCYATYKGKKMEKNRELIIRLTGEAE